MNPKPTPAAGENSRFYVVPVGPGFAVATKDEEGQERIRRNSYTSRRWVAVHEASVWNNNQTTAKPQLA